MEAQDEMCVRGLTLILLHGSCRLFLYLFLIRVQPPTHGGNI